MSENEGGGQRRFLGVSFNKNISVGTLTILLMQAVGGSFIAGMVWKSVVETPTKIETLTTSIDKRFSALDERLAPFTQQASQITDLYARTQDLRTRQDQAGSEIVQLRVDMSGVKSDVSNIKAATAACMPGDRRPECRGRN